MTRIITTTNYGENSEPFFDVTEDYEIVKRLLDNCITNNLALMELHLATDNKYFHNAFNNAILIKVSTIVEILDIDTRHDNYSQIMKLSTVYNLAQLLVVKKDDYNYTSNLLFENFPDRQSAVDATIEKLEDTYDKEKFGLMDKIYKESNPDD